MSYVQQLEQHLANQKALVEQRKLVARLRQNRDFRKLILEGFCLQEAARHVINSVNVALEPEAREHSLQLAQAAGHLSHWLAVQEQMGEHAERTLADVENELVEARQEEADA